jgi:ribonuclease BN (tRNA processing enzyme)
MEKRLKILAAEGFEAFWDGLKKAWGHWIELDSIEVEELSATFETAIQDPPFIIKTAPANHSDSSIAFRIEDSHGRSVVFSGDTDVSDNIIKLAKGADLLVMECAFPEGHKVKGHLTPSEAGLMAEKAGVKQLVLTHFYPVCDQHDMASPCRDHFSGTLILAEDLLRVGL